MASKKKPQQVIPPTDPSPRPNRATRRIRSEKPKGKPKASKDGPSMVDAMTKGAEALASAIGATIRPLPAHLVPGNPGNSGGKKGRSGRPKNVFTASMRALMDDPHVRAAMYGAMCNPTTPGYAALVGTVAKLAKRMPQTGMKVTVPGAGPDGQPALMIELDL